LEYADVVWNNKTLFLINKLENVQIEAARITRVPDKEWSFQDGGLYIIKKVGVKILTIIVLYMLA
jgi:predicted nucleic acid-binding protein